MKESIYRISLDIHKAGSQVMLDVKKIDSARKLLVSLTESGVPFPISDVCRVVFRAQKPDGKIIYNDCVVNGNLIEYVLTKATTDTVGLVECELTLYGADLRQITSPRFTLVVGDVVASDEEIEGTNEFTALSQCFEWADNMDISVEKVGKGATIKVTTKDGIEKSVTVFDGENGKDGEKGETGEKGEKGDTGPKGDKGDKGDVGPRGPIGDIGPTGEPGPRGLQGIQGPAGADGKTAYEYAVENGYTGTEEDFKALMAFVDVDVKNSLSMGRKAGTTVGVNSTAIGTITTASGDFSHAEGQETVASGYVGHAEGKRTVASGNYSHIEGESYNCNENTFSGASAMIAAWNTAKFARAAGNASHVEGRNSLAIGSVSHAEGHVNIATGAASHAEGEETQASGSYAHAQGKRTIASGNNSHAQGGETTASGSNSHAEGYLSEATGDCAHAEGNYSKATGPWSHAQGFHTEASASCAHAEGKYTKATCDYQHVQGKFNAVDTESKYAHIVGNGTSTTNRSNAHTTDWQGNAWYQGSVTSNGADYAEFFEWLDGNPDQEDRVGLIVALDGEKIKLANSGDDILGIISATAAVLGDNYECEWNGKYLTDDFGRILYDEVEEFVEVPKTIISEIENEETGEIETIETVETEIQSLGFFKHPKINPDYDPEQAYVNRTDRPEWDTVGMVGKLYLRDDGTCELNSYATVGADGIATVSDEKTNMRVLSRVSENIVRVLLK